ncbi:MAG TPA: 6-phosphogluconolactonase [Microbacteriaceae bacterium]|nr:6-phosphogluconolactonase [Microbacteriaceae bacterium]
MTRRVLVWPDVDAMAAGVAASFADLCSSWLASHDGPMHVALTGGRSGAASMRALAALPEEAIDWDRIHLWWGDERWLPAGDSERNDELADQCLLNHISIPAGNIHRVAAPDQGIDIDEAAARYRNELARFETDPNWGHPEFALVFLGVGPDGHIASLFPHRTGIEVTDVPVIAVTDSPKPPSERVSITRPVINSAAHVWLMLSGADKASALGLALAGASRVEVPAAGIKGRVETVYFADQAAASAVPANVTLRFGIGDRVGRD